MKTLEKLKENGFQELDRNKLQHCIGGYMQSTNETQTWTTCNERTGEVTHVKAVTVDNPDGSSCTSYSYTTTCC